MVTLLGLSLSSPRDKGLLKIQEILGKTNSTILHHQYLDILLVLPIEHSCPNINQYQITLKKL